MNCLISPRARGFTLVETLVTLAIVSLLVATLLPALQQVRESARRMTCSNHLRQMGLALQNYHSTFGYFPPGKILARVLQPGACDDGEIEVEDNHGQCTSYQSWSSVCLPFLEESSLAEKYHGEQAWSSLANRAAVVTPLSVFICPSAPSQDRRDPHHVRGAAATDYGTINIVENRVYTDVFGIPDPGLAARQGALSTQGSIRVNRAPRVTDGLSKTAVLTECAGRPDTFVLGYPMNAEQFANYNGDEVVQVAGHYLADDGIGWADPESEINVKGIAESSFELYGPRMINAINTGEAYSFHPGGALFMIADGSVRFLTDDIDSWLYVSLCTRAGGEVVGEF